jgi:hypothetical protein
MWYVTTKVPNGYGAPFLAWQHSVRGRYFNLDFIHIVVIEVIIIIIIKCKTFYGRHDIMCSKF